LHDGVVEIAQVEAIAEFRLRMRAQA